MEREFLSWLQQQNVADPKIKIAMGDDAAIVRGFENLAGIVIATEALADGTHFDVQQHELQRIGRKALAVNLSDIAAMGATPIAAVLNLMLPKDFTIDLAQQIFHGCQKLANEFSLSIVGGDTNRWDGKLVISVTVIGQEFDCDGHTKHWKMSGAKAGDMIVVSGSFGGSILGHHLDFLPRVQLSQYLIQNYSINAATDCSDSLSLDLAAVAQSSGIGVELVADKIPIAEAAQILAQRSGRTPLDHALTDGEDFELILCVTQSEIARVMGDENICSQLTVIGRCTPKPDFCLIRNDRRELFQPAGYSH